MLVAPVIMSGADLLFSTLKEDGYVKETQRHNLKMEELETNRIKWQEKFTSKEAAFLKRRLTKQDASEKATLDRAILDELLVEKSVLKSQLQNELSKHKKKNPYYLTADLVVTAGIVLSSVAVWRLCSRNKSTNL